MGGAPDTDVLREVLLQVYLVNEKEQLTDISYSVTGEHDSRRGGTTGGAPDTDVLRVIL